MRLQKDSRAIMEALQELLPGRKLNEDFMEIMEEGTGLDSEMGYNERWHREPRRVLEAFFHARMMLQLAVTYAGQLEAPPSTLPSGWAAVLYLYRLR